METFQQYINVFGALPATDSQLLLSRMYVRQVYAGEQLLQAGKICQWIAFVQHGVFRRYELVEAEEVIREFVSEGGFLSDYTSFLTGQPATTSIEALEAGDVLLLSGTHLQQLFSQSTPIESFARRVMEESFVSCHAYNSLLATKTSAERYQLFTQRYPALMQRVPLYMVASFLGMRPETLSRVRRLP